MFCKIKRAMHDKAYERHSEMVSELGLRVNLLMCPRRIEQTQF